MPSGFTADQNKRFNINRVTQKILNKELTKRKKILEDALNSNKIKKIKTGCTNSFR